MITYHDEVGRVWVGWPLGELLRMIINQTGSSKCRPPLGITRLKVGVEAAEFMSGLGLQLLLGQSADVQATFSFAKPH